MRRAKHFADKYKEHILKRMDEHKSDGSYSDFVEIIRLCEGYNEVCECIEYMEETGEKHSMGAGLFNDNPGRYGR